MFKLVAFAFLLLLPLSFSKPANKTKPYQVELEWRRPNYAQLIQQQKQVKNGRLIQSIMQADGIFWKWNIGTPEKEYKLRVETGTYGAWLISSNYFGTADSTYDSTQSSTFSANGLGDWGISHNVMFIADQAYDVFNDGQVKFNQAFGLTTEISDLVTQANDFPIIGFSGVLGLAWTYTQVSQQPGPDSTILVNMLPNQAKIMYTLAFDRTDKNGDIQNTPYITLGDLDAKHCQNDQYALANFAADGEEVPLMSVATEFSIGTAKKRDTWFGALDSGTTFIFIPQNIFDSIERLVPATFDESLGFYTIDCAQKTQAPDFSVTLSGKDGSTKQYSVPASVYIFEVDTNKCAIAFYPTSEGQQISQFVLGLTFIQNYCSIYDYNNNQVGLASLIH